MWTLLALTTNLFKERSHSSSYEVGVSIIYLWVPPPALAELLAALAALAAAPSTERRLLATIAAAAAAADPLHDE